MDKISEAKSQAYIGEAKAALKTACGEAASLPLFVVSGHQNQHEPLL